MRLLEIISLSRLEGITKYQSSHAEDRVHRSADLMTHVGDERTLGLVRGLGDLSRLPIRLGLHASCDVTSDADSAGHTAVAAAERSLDGLDQGVIAIRIDVALFDAFGSRRCHDFGVVTPIVLGQFQWGNLEVGLADHLTRLSKSFRDRERSVDSDEVA